MNHWKQRKIEPMKLDGVSISSIILEEREESERRMLAVHRGKYGDVVLYAWYRNISFGYQ